MLAFRRSAITRVSLILQHSASLTTVQVWFVAEQSVHQLDAAAHRLCSAGFNMVARFGMFHRSLYPAIRVARGHYVFCSHVGQPLSCWDKR